MKLSLNGNWSLYFAEAEASNPDISKGLNESGLTYIPATVPGNVEKDLSAAGYLPSDLYKGMNILQAERFETFEWWYEKSFTMPAPPCSDERAVLIFHGVDCCAEYYLNGKYIGYSDNMLISHEFDVTDVVEYNCDNTLVVHIKSIATVYEEDEREPNAYSSEWGIPKFLLNIRKAPHMSGWDIMPRMVSAGIWRNTEIIYKNKHQIKYLYLITDRIEGGTAKCRLMFDACVPVKYRLACLKTDIILKCGEQVIHYTFNRDGCTGEQAFDVPDAQLWWPKPYGNPDLYEITLRLYSDDGILDLTKTVRTGIRTLRLRHSDIVEKDGGFEFIINNTKIMAIGTNWVPLDALHSNDHTRYQKALELADDIGCNIIRCWGGNVYEDHEFFDFCDEHGIMVWQDFAMACHCYPQTEKFHNKIKKEAEWIVRELRDHPSIVLWSGDNEIDELFVQLGKDPATNHITREVIPRVIERLDQSRPYLPSSPYITAKAMAMGENRQGSQYYPEDHLWGPRDYFKSEFYKKAGAYFISEIGYHGCPNLQSIEKFIDKDYIWPYFDNEQWILHSSDRHGNDGRVMLMHKQVKQLFGDVPTNIEDYILASQISQAEAVKFFIEHTRAQMQRMGGVIWWNLIDGWPQFSDAVVDYYYSKKLAYEYIKRSEQPFIIMVDEMSDWGQNIVCANSTLSSESGHVKITELNNDTVIFETEYTASPNSNTVIGKIDTMYSDKVMLLIEWTDEKGNRSINTYLCGFPAFELDEYKKWLTKIK